MNQRTASLLLSLIILHPVSSGIRAANATSPAMIAPSRNLQIVGTWQSAQFGRQTLTTKSDGTAELKMRLTPMAAVLYGKEVTLQLKWTLDGDNLTQHVVDGSPERSVQKLTQKYGHTYSYRILKLSDSQLVVEDTTSGKVCHWESLPVVAANN